MQKHDGPKDLLQKNDTNTAEVNGPDPGHLGATGCIS